MTRSLALLLLLLPTILFAQIDMDVHGVVQPRVAFTANGAAAVWAYNGIYFAMDVTRGPVRPEHQLLLASGGRNPALATDGENVLVVWLADTHRPRRPRLDAALVGRGGMIGAPFQIAEGDARTAAAVRWNGRNYVIAWHDPHERGLRTTSVDRFGNFLGQINDVIDATPSYRVAIATDGDRSLIVTKDSLVLVDRDALPLAQNAGGGDDAAWNGSEYFVVQSDDAGIRGTRVSRNGKALAAATMLTNDGGHDPRVAWNGREMQLMWVVDGTVRLARIGEAGDEIWSDRTVDAENFDIAARTNGQIIIARGPAAVAGHVISFDIRTPRRRAIAVAN